MPKLLTIQIPTPCSEDPSKMLPTQKGSYCNSCKKEVIDFTGKSDYQLAAFFKNNHDHVCGRFYPDQLNKQILIPKQELPWLKYFFTIVIPGFLFSVRSSAQIKSHTDAITIVDKQISQQRENKMTRSRVLFGKVKDEKGNAVEGASVCIAHANNCTETDEDGYFYLTINPQDTVLQISSLSIISKEIKINAEKNMDVIVQRKNINSDMLVVMAGGIEAQFYYKKEHAKAFKGKIIDQKGIPVEAASIRILNSNRGTITNQNGIFQMKLKTADSVISISGIGIITKEVLIDRENPKDIIVERKPDALELVTVKTTALSIKRPPVMLGGFVSTFSTTKVVPPQKVLTPPGNTNEFSIYPSPVTSGSELNISWKNKVESDQLIEIFSADGRLIQKETVRVTGKISACSFVIKNTDPGFYIFMVTDMKTGRKISREFIVE